MPLHADIASALDRNGAFPEGGPVERRETHISTVFLTREHAWKLLKPVRFDFLDFSTREARYVECWNEVLLNRRLAPDVYLGVVPLHADSVGSVRVAGSGTPVDWLILMRRLPSDATLEARIAAGTASTADIDRILDVLCPFFARAATNPQIAADGLPRVVHRNVSENLNVLAAHVGNGTRDSVDDGRPIGAEQIDRLRSMQLQFVAVREPLLESRIDAGRVRELHGDLKPEHCYLGQWTVDSGQWVEEKSSVRDYPLSTIHYPLSPVIIDCIAFNRRFRHVDTLDEVCFLAVELSHLDRDDLAKHLFREYRRRTGDDASDELAAFFQSYRLTVRAKVACLAADGEEDGTERDRRLRAAASYVDDALERLRPHHRPRLIAVFGLSGTGKSTVARALAERIGATHLSSDEIRKRIHGLPIHRRGPADIYTSEANSRTYAALLDAARDRLRQGTSVIVDATFRRRMDRERLISVAKKAGVSPLFVECRCDSAVARRRIEKRNEKGIDASDADVAIHEAQSRSHEAPAEIPSNILLCIDTERPLEDSIGQIVTALRVV
ncbi:MAG: AAA family ATPase [Planctomycetaceae bacterium]